MFLFDRNKKPKASESKEKVAAIPAMGITCAHAPLMPPPDLGWRSAYSAAIKLSMMGL
jgi:hypothetical protein